MAGHADSASGGLTGPATAEADPDAVADSDEAEAEAEAEGLATEMESTAMGSTRASSPIRLAAIVGAAFFVALAGLIGWLGFGVFQSHKEEGQRQLLVQTARQGALNLTTIDWQQADADVQRIIDSATGTFKSDFSEKSHPFVEVVKQVKSTSVGTVTGAALESTSGDDAQVLVTTTVKTTMPNEPEAAPKSWRMRISLHKLNDSDVKISDVKFVP